MRNQDLVADAIVQSRALLTRYLAGFDDATLTRQAPALPNHFAWTLGHLALTMHRVAERIDGQGLPARDFVRGETRPAGAYDTEMVAYGSVPTTRGEQYPGAARCREIFDAACERLVGCFRACEEPKLMEMTAWGGGEITIRDLGLRMAFHNGIHCGQIADLRRAFGMKSVMS